MVRADRDGDARVHEIRNSFQGIDNNNFREKKNERSCFGERLG